MSNDSAPNMTAEYEAAYKLLRAQATPELERQLRDSDRIQDSDSLPPAVQRFVKRVIAIAEESYDKKVLKSSGQFSKPDVM